LNLDELYDQLISLDPVTKIFFTFFFGLVIFLYKTFLNMYSEDNKQSQFIKIKEGELLGKAEASIAIYESGPKDMAAQDKLIEVFGECYCYLSGGHKQKVREFYENRSDVTLATLKTLFSAKIDSISSFTEKPMALDQVYTFIAKVFKPLLPLISIMIMLFFLGINYSTFTQASTFWGKLEVMVSWMAVILSLIFLLSVLNKWPRDLGFKPWAHIIVIIVCPFIVYVIQPQWIAFTAIVQFISLTVLHRTKNTSFVMQV